jgi:hypothetical protein
MASRMLYGLRHLDVGARKHRISGVRHDPQDRQA